MCCVVFVYCHRGIWHTDFRISDGCDVEWIMLNAVVREVSTNADGCVHHVPHVFKLFATLLPASYNVQLGVPDCQLSTTVLSVVDDSLVVEPSSTSARIQ